MMCITGGELKFWDFPPDGSSSYVCLPVEEEATLAQVTIGNWDTYKDHGNVFNYQVIIKIVTVGVSVLTIRIPVTLNARFLVPLHYNALV